MFNKIATYIRQSADDVAFFALVFCTSGLLMFELTSLFVAPVVDSYLWWGDESWLMLEFRNQIVTGRFAHPLALGSSLLQGSGVLFSNMWLTAALYGIPAALTKSGAIVMTGRIVTALIAVSLVFALYEILRRLTHERTLSIFAVLLLVASRSFFFTSHSARYDILTALAVLTGIYLLTQLVSITRLHSFVQGAVIAAGLLISVHVTLLLALPGLVLIIYRSPSRWKDVLVYCFGFAAICGLFFLAAALEHQTSAMSGAYALNVHDIPALRLYSRSVQLANLAQRWHVVSSLAFAIVLVGIAVSVLSIISAIRRKQGPSLEVLVIIASLLSWLEFESAAPTSYLIYVLPLLAIAVSLGIKRLLPHRLMPLLLVIAIPIVVYGVKDFGKARRVGTELTRANASAIEAALYEIEQDSTHPVVLTFTPAVHRVMMDTAVQTMTTQFIEFPATEASVDSILSRERVRYVMVYHSSLKPDYMREVIPITEAAKRMGTLDWERPGIMTDIGRSYFEEPRGMDTLHVYKLRD